MPTIMTPTRDHNNGKEFDVLKMIYDHQTETLRFMTNYDFTAFRYFILTQFIIGAWLVIYKETIIQQQMIGIFVIDLIFAWVAWMLIYKNYLRRLEIARTLENINDAFELKRSGAFIVDHPIMYYHASKKGDPRKKNTSTMCPIRHWDIRSHTRCRDDHAVSPGRCRVLRSVINSCSYVDCPSPEGITDRQRGP